MKVVHRIRPLAQVIPEDDGGCIQVNVDEMRAEIHDEICEKGLIPRKSFGYHAELFALSSVIYVRVCIEIMDEDEIEEARAHVA